MEALCEFCGVVRAVVYCKPDSARLCLHCDGCVHSANSLSRRHPRSLLCDKCHFDSAILRCLDHKWSLCQVCDWNTIECSVLGHRRLPLTFYTDCPSLAELYRIWPHLADPSSSSPSSSLPKNDSSTSKLLEQPDNKDGSFGLGSVKLDEEEPYGRYEPWVGQSAIVPSNSNYTQYCKNEAFFFNQDSNQPKGCPNVKDLRIHEETDLCEGLNVDDVQLNFESADEIFDCSQGVTRYPHAADGGIECLLMDKNIAATKSSSLIETAMEASSSIPQDCVAFPSSGAGESASVMQTINSNANCALVTPSPSCKTNFTLGFPQGQIHSSLSNQLSNINGESSANEYQDCGLPPVFLPGESPWEPNLGDTRPQARGEALKRYEKKKRTRTFSKQIRYASRKARADTRKRVKGRFVKAGEAYDYDPLVSSDN